MKSDGVSDNGLHEEKSQNSRSGSQALKNEGKKNRCVQGGCESCKCGRRRVQGLPDVYEVGGAGQSAKGDSKQEKEAVQNQTQKG